MNESNASSLRVLVVHNSYRSTGGEDSVFANEVELLRRAGCEVETLQVSNHDIRGVMGALGAALGTIYSRSGRAIVATALAKFRPDVLHVHNFFPLLSPALFDACADAGVPAVWTLHNFRVTCPNGLLFREGKPCELCVGHLPLPAIVHRCYRNSIAGSAVVAGMVGFHRARGTWKTKVAKFIALNTHARQILMQAGLPPSKIVVKPNFTFDLQASGGPASKRSGALFVGRLSSEKGAHTLIEAWKSLPDIPLTMVGDGPERAALEQAAPANVHFAGFLPSERVAEKLATAEALIMPTHLYENCPMSVIEAMSLGTAIIASRIGALETIVTDRIDGLHFNPADSADLAQVVRGAFADRAMLARLGDGARKTWKARFSPERNLEQLLAIYREAITC